MQKSYNYNYGAGNYYGSMGAVTGDYGSNPSAMMCGTPGGSYEEPYNTTPPLQNTPHGNHMRGPADSSALDAYRASCLMATNGSNGHSTGLNCNGPNDNQQQQLMGQLAEGMYGRDQLGYPGVMQPPSGMPDSMYWNKLSYGDPNNQHMVIEPGNGNCGPGSLTPGHPGAMHPMHPGPSPPVITEDPGCGGGNVTEFPWMKDKRNTSKRKSPSETTSASRLSQQSTANLGKLNTHALTKYH